MKMAAPMVIGFLGKKVSGGNMNASGLMSLLTGQKSNIMSAVPAGFGSLLGFSGLKNAIGGAAKAATNTVGNAAASTVETGKKAASSGLGFLKWLLPLLLLALLGIFLWKSCGGAVSDMADNAATTVVDGATDAANAAGDAANAGANAVGDAAHAGVNAAGDVANAAGDAAAGIVNRVKSSLPGGVEIEANEGGVESQLLGFVKSNKAVDKTSWFNFDALTFKTGSAQLDMEKSKVQLDNMVAILNAYPKVNLKLGGYTDSDGDDKMNLKLSQDRADMVLAYLIGKGIDKSRLAAEGFGEQFPVCAANDTPECKAKNRRIAVRVTAK